jgi:hypothetical protein
MALTGSFAGLHRLVKQMAEAGRGELMEAIRKEVAAEIAKLMQEGFTGRVSPKFTPWRGTQGQALSMVKSGELLRSLRVELLHEGIRVSLRGKALSRGNVAGVQQFGGFIVSGFHKKSVGGAKSRAYLANMATGKGLMRFKIGGRWVSSYGTHHAPNPLMPNRGTLPDAWAKRLGEAVQRAVRRWRG